MADTRKGRKTAKTIDLEIKHMVEYIEQDGLEKVEEIELKAEEEFMIEKNKVRDDNMAKIAKHYDRLEGRINKNTKAEFCRSEHRSRLAYLHAEHIILSTVREEAKDRLRNVHCTENQDAYRKILTALILQGLFKLMEDNVTVKFLEDDGGVIDDCLSKASSTYKDKLNKEVEITKSDQHLKEHEIGGVILVAKDGNVTVVNTLESRFRNVAEESDSSIMPVYRYMLFGQNPNRKHLD